MAVLGFGDESDTVFLRNAILRMIVSRAQRHVVDPADLEELEVSKGIGAISFYLLDNHQRARLVEAVYQGTRDLTEEIAGSAKITSTLSPSSASGDSTTTRQSGPQASGGWLLARRRRVWPRRSLIRQALILLKCGRCTGKNPMSTCKITCSSLTSFRMSSIRLSRGSLYTPVRVEGPVAGRS